MTDKNFPSVKTYLAVAFTGIVFGDKAAQEGLYRMPGETYSGFEATEYHIELVFITAVLAPVFFIGFWFILERAEKLIGGLVSRSDYVNNIGVTGDE